MRKSFIIHLLIVITAMVGAVFNILLLTDTVYGQEISTTGNIKSITLIASEKEIQVAPDNAVHPGGLKYKAMVFNDTIPGPVIAVNQGDQLQITLRNEGNLVHSLTIQAAFGANQANSGPIKPGESKTWTINAANAGAFLYYSNGDAMNGAWEQVADGMYGGIIVHPQNEKPAKEFYVVFSEIYMNGSNGSFDINKFINNTPDLVLINGMAYKYMPTIGAIAKLELNNDAQVFKVKPGEQTRWYILNAGPRGYVAFNFVGGMLDVHEGSIQSRFGTQLLNGQTWTIPPGSGSVIESIFPEEGLYIGIDHDLGRFFLGGAFAISASSSSTATDHPAGTWVPPKGSENTAAPNIDQDTGGSLLFKGSSQS